MCRRPSVARANWVKIPKSVTVGIRARLSKMSGSDIFIAVEPSEKRQWPPKPEKSGKSVNPTRDHIEELAPLEERLGLVEHDVHKVAKCIEVFKHHHAGREHSARKFEDGV